MNGVDDHDLLFDWNARRRRSKLSPRPVFEFHDETLRDGIQGPSIVDPSIEDKKRIIELTDALGVHSADIGLPGAGPRAVEDVTAIVRPTGQRTELGAFHTPAGYDGEWRCDLHPRFSSDGQLVTIDSPHGGNGRQIYLLQIQESFANS